MILEEFDNNKHAIIDPDMLHETPIKDFPEVTVEALFDAILQQHPREEHPFHDPAPEDPVEQRLTISSTGRIWFSERVFGPLGDNHYPIGRKIQMSIGKECAAAILSKLADYADSNPLLIFCMDIGNWHLMLTGADGTKTEMSCSMNGDVFVGDDDLTDFIRAKVPIDGLAVFGGDSEKEDFDEDSNLEF